MENISSEEKLDYIYETLKKQEKRIFWSRITKRWFRIFLLAYFYYAYVFLLPSLIETIKTSLTPKMSANLDLKSITDKIDIKELKEKLIKKYKDNY